MKEVEAAKQELKRRNLRYTIKEFKKSFSGNDTGEIFDLYIKAGILSKVKIPENILIHCAKKGSVQNMNVLLKEMDIKNINGKAFFWIVSRIFSELDGARHNPLFSEYHVPDENLLKTKLRIYQEWRGIIFSTIEKAEDVNYKESHTGSYDNDKVTITSYFTPMSIAIMMDDMELIQLLIEYGAVIYDDLLHLIFQNPHATTDKMLMIAECLLGTNKLDLSLKNEDGLTPLAIAAQNNYLDLVKLFVSHGASIDEKVGKEEVNNTKTALLISITEKNFSIAQFLIDHGADIHYRDKWGFSAARLAFYKGNSELGEELIRKGAILTPYIGIFGKSLKDKGVLVEGLDTFFGSAHEAGIKEGDIITMIAGFEIKNHFDIKSALSKYRPLDIVPIMVLRDSKTHEFSIKILVA
ncbi:ankyrin repeat domain-containing protein [Allomuricauda sp. CP2A]|jgi:hypothetical protein|uniref:ankyrin repeat domain-containing protein n=1 Tax=Allomuricauda sp. CP2A TaxID=1848189 RepID=UPI00083098BD|nr:ankyrin repeat domain-containing protein [Muricauda sp. CP2A]